MLNPGRLIVVDRQWTAKRLVLVKQKMLFTDAVDLTPDLTHVKFQKSLSRNEVSRPPKLCGQTIDRQTVSFGRIKNSKM